MRTSGSRHRCRSASAHATTSSSHSDEALARLVASVRVQHAEAVPSRMVTSEEAADLVPGLRADGIAGASWCAADGFFDRPQRVVEAFAQALDIRIQSVDSLGRRLGDAVVVAAGAGTRELLPELPIELEDRFLFLSEPIRERLLEPLIVSSECRFAAKQLGDGRVLASDLGARGDEAQRETWRATVQAGIEELLPQLAHVSFPVLIHGKYDVTPDHQPLVGRSKTGSTSRLASAATAS